MKYSNAVIAFLICTRVSAFPSPRDDDRMREPDRCILCHGNREPAPAPRPRIAEQFSMQWRMFELTSEQRPPFAAIPKPHSFITGRTFYDWPRKEMTEIYPDKCIDIFPSGREFACQFTSIGDKTFFIKFRDHDTQRPESCCLWRKTEFWAPRPDVLQTMAFDRKMPLEAKNANWWVLDIPLPGPFGYGLFESSGEPAAFWFPVMRGWVQQNFSRFEGRKPDPKYFRLPEICKGELPECPDT